MIELFTNIAVRCEENFRYPKNGKVRKVSMRFGAKL